MSPTFARKRATAMRLIKKHHGPLKPRSDGPAWHHLDRVSKLLELILEETGEGSAEERETITLSAIGHDAIEDTSVGAIELRAVFGPQGLLLIEGMTDPHGDKQPTKYTAQVTASEEGVRLIKLADLYDNCTSVIYGIGSLGAKWAEDYFLPIVTPMVASVTATGFPRFPKAAERLKAMVKTSYAMLLDAVSRQKGT